MKTNSNTAKSLIMAYRPVFLAAVIIGLCFAFLANMQQAESAPLESTRQVFTWANAEVLTASTSYAATNWGDGNIYPHTNADIFWVIDQTAVNTLSLALQVSPDGTTYINHNTAAALVTNNVADATSYTSTTIQGAYYKIVATAANTNPVTLTLKVVLR